MPLTAFCFSFGFNSMQFRAFFNILYPSRIIEIKAENN